VGIIVLNWKGLEDTTECCRSLEKVTYRATKVYVADNASADGSAEALRQRFPGFTCVANETNLGYARGNNRMIQEAIADGCEYVLLLNNDTLVDAAFVEPLVEAMQANGRVGIAGSKIYYVDRPQVIWFAGGKVEMSRRFPFRHIGEDETDAGQFDKASETEWVSGCALLARADMIRAIGSLDERFGYYCEDVDWCFRARRSGWEVWYVPGSKVWHKIGASTRRGSLPVHYYSCRNALLVTRSMFTGVARLRFIARALKQALAYSCYFGDKAAVLEATLQGLAGRSGTAPTMGKAWWSKGVVTIERAVRKFSRLFERRCS